MVRLAALWIVLLALAASVGAQDVTVPTVQVDANTLLTPSVVTETPTALPTATLTPSPTLPPPVDVVPTGEAVPTAASPVSLGADLSVLITAQSDLELLAAATLGAQRPLGWSGIPDLTNPQLPLLVRLDLELLAGTLVGASVRPPGWFGAVGSSPFAVARDIRHDLELLADMVIGPNVRPPGWTGDDPLIRCSRPVQNLVNLLERGGTFVLMVDPNSADYCLQVEYQASQFTEELLHTGVNIAQTGGIVTTPGAETPTITTAETTLALAEAVYPQPLSTQAYLDRSASRRVGIIPADEPLQPIARSYSTFSRMLLVRGSGFEVFVDYTTTTMTPQAYDALPDVDAIEVIASCAADWCEE